MITTKHDLCAGVAKLNLNELIKTAEIAVCLSRWDCERYLRDVQEKQLENNPDKWRKTYRVASSACLLAETANKLAQATNTLHYLLSAQDRSEIVVEKEK